MACGGLLGGTRDGPVAGGGPSDGVKRLVQCRIDERTQLGKPDHDALYNSPDPHVGALVDF